MMNRKTKFLWLLGVHGFIQFTADVYQFMDTFFFVFTTKSVNTTTLPSTSI